MKKNLSKKVAVILSFNVIIFHICWIYNYSLFMKFTDGLNELKKFETFSVLKDNYIYHVKFPYYLRFTGNLAVATSKNEYTLIIWPSRYKQTEYGVMLPIEEDTVISIMIDKNLKAEDQYDQIYVEQNREQIEDLFQKAYDKWGGQYE